VDVTKRCQAPLVDICLLWVYKKASSNLDDAFLILVILVSCTVLKVSVSCIKDSCHDDR
jgi:hypothetical protein